MLPAVQLLDLPNNNIYFQFLFLFFSSSQLPSLFFNSFPTPSHSYPHPNSHPYSPSHSQPHSQPHLILILIVVCSSLLFSILFLMPLSFPSSSSFSSSFSCSFSSSFQILLLVFELISNLDVRRRWEKQFPTMEVIEEHEKYKVVYW